MPRQVAGKVACSGFETSGKKPGILGMVFSTRMLVAFVMGYVSGLSLLLTLSVL